MLSISVSEVVFTETIETADYWFGEMICGFVDKEGIQFTFLVWYPTGLCLYHSLVMKGDQEVFKLCCK